MIDPILRASLEVQPFARAIVGAASREVAFLRVEDDATGRVGFGECAPLAGLHRETLDEALAAIEDWMDGIREVDELPPSAAFAVSCALATSEGFAGGIVRDAEVAGFFGGTAAELTDGEVARLRGMRSVKLKIGRASAADDRALVARALDALPQARLRLDGNRRMARASCTDILRGIDPARIEYLEEPLADPSELAELSRATGMPVALDELVVDGSDDARALREDLARTKCVAAWVLRMSAVGSLDRVYDRAAEAARLGADAVLSTAYESSYTLRLAVHLAAAIPNARRAHGLGTAHVLLQDSCAAAVVLDGRIAGTSVPAPFAEAWS
jgi:O-succinylbenzoate synthase